MSGADYTLAHREMGKWASLAVSILVLAYVPTLVLGLLSLKNSQAAIGDPYFTILEILIVVMAPFMVLVMVAIHGYAPRDYKALSLAALAFMVLAAGITSLVHFIILTVSRPIAAAGVPDTSYFFSFTWPSVLYAADILAWDLFFALSMVLAAPVFREGGLERRIRWAMLVSGTISFVGLAGIPFLSQTAVVRDVGVVGYAGVSLVTFPLLFQLFRRSKPVARSA